MNGIHDLGGMDGFGPIVRETDEPVFHAPWEGRIFAIANALMGAGLSNADQFRHAIERMPPREYLTTSYYEHWLAAIETLIREHGLGAGSTAQPFPQRSFDSRVGTRAGASSAAAGQRARARFRVGERVVARNLNPRGHTRLPRYVRGHRGVVVRDLGVSVFPDSNAHGGPANRQHCYNVAFTARELWGVPGRAQVHIDLWEDYLAPMSRPATGSKRVTHRPSRKRERRGS